MGAFSDTSFEQLPLAAKRRIDAACARFEEGWAHGGPTLEQLCADADDNERPVLLAELLHIDLERRRKAGEAPTAADYLARFPALAAVIRDVVPAAANGRAEAPAGESAPPGPRGPGAPPVRVPGYEVLEEIGRGGMGVVYKARHQALNRLVALKFILTGSHAAARHRERFRREAEVVARLGHPHIVQIYDIGEAEGQVFLALEFAEAGSLRDRLGGEPMAPRAAASMLEPLARAVQHAHRQGVVHRDIKPANVLLAPGGDSLALGNRPLPDWQGLGEGPLFADPLPPLTACTPKLTDFGLARMLDDAGPDAAVAVGTPSYMSPEQAVGGAGGPESDVWALGATLYELLTGRPPFRAATAIETLGLVLDVDPVPPTQLQPSVPRDLETICLKCLEKKPARRYAGARELAQDLRHFLDGEPIAARRMSRLQRGLRWARRRPRAAALAALLVVLLLGGVGWLAAALGHALAGRAEARRQADANRANADEERRQRQRQGAQSLYDLALVRAGAGDVNTALHDLVAALRIVPEGEEALDRAIRVALARWGPWAWVRTHAWEWEPGVTCWAVRPGGWERYLARGREVLGGILIGGRPLRAWDHQAPVRAMTLSDDGKRMLICEGEGRAPTIASFRDPDSGKMIGQEMRHPKGIALAQVWDDGSGAVTADEEGTVRRWNTEGRELAQALRHPVALAGLSLSRQGKHLATIVNERDRHAAWLWAVAGQAPRARVLTHPARVTAAGFSADGARLWTACADGLVRCWSTAEGALLPPTIQAPFEIVHLSFSRDGRFTVLASATTVHLRDASFGAPLARVPGQAPLALLDGAVFGERKRLLVSAPGELWVYELPRPEGPPSGQPVEGSADELTREVEWLTGLARDGTGELRPLSVAEWKKRQVERPRLPR